MKTFDLTVCGVDELPGHGAHGVTHVLSILDPGFPEPDAFGAYGEHKRTALRFHDVIEPGPRLVLPKRDDVETVLAFGRDLTAEKGHLLIHCQMGISRSTAAMAMIMAQGSPDTPEAEIMDRLLAIRGKAWPNSVMLGFADELLGRDGRLVQAAHRLYAHQLALRPDLDAVMTHLGRAREVRMGLDLLAKTETPA